MHAVATKPSLIGRHVPGLPRLDVPMQNLPWDQTDIATGLPLPTLENVEVVLAGYQIEIACPMLYADDFVPFFGERYIASAEHQRDCHIERFRGTCTANRLDLRHDRLAEYLQMIGLLRADRERRAANRQRLKRGGAL